MVAVPNIVAKNPPNSYAAEDSQRSQASPLLKYGYADSRPSGVFVSDRARGYRNPFGNYFDDVAGSE
ncbi:1328_t:CDS:2 [Paraglomus brasilianum]|uniref:1328_t:CDS:1 n=1 Tax=Paraglomus brasilianum TaxID=144538 RepID=A0A9N9BVJ3_9GLOM|nr:1328_t:CDS:2 [Paraglomus brasilianum]